MVCNDPMKTFNWTLLPRSLSCVRMEREVSDLWEKWTIRYPSRGGGKVQPLVTMTLSSNSFLFFRKLNLVTTLLKREALMTAASHSHHTMQATTPSAYRQITLAVGLHITHISVSISTSLLVLPNPTMIMTVLMLPNLHPKFETWTRSWKTYEGSNNTSEKGKRTTEILARLPMLELFGTVSRRLLFYW